MKTKSLFRRMNRITTSDRYELYDEAYARVWLAWR